MRYKELQVKTWTSPGKEPALTTHRNVTVFHGQEAYHIHIANYDTAKYEHPDHECSLIDIKFPSGKHWKGSINDLEAIFSILKNAEKSLLNCNKGDVHSICNIQDSLLEISETLQQYK